MREERKRGEGMGGGKDVHLRAVAKYVGGAPAGQGCVHCAFA